jgi:hypothetical protein
MKVKDMIEMLELADKDSQVMLEVRDKNVNLIGYFEVGSDHQETGGYDPNELDHFKWLNEPRSKAVVELTINNNEWVGLGIDMEEE